MVYVRDQPTSDRAFLKALLRSDWPKRLTSRGGRLSQRQPILLVSRTPGAVTDDAVGLQGGCWTIRYLSQTNRLAYLNLLAAPLKSSQRVYLLRSTGHRTGHQVVKIPPRTPSDRLANHVLCMHGRLVRELPAGRAEIPREWGSEDAIGGQSRIPTTGNISRALWAPASPHPLACRCARLEQFGRIS
jgi:hypothetical protein